MSSANAKSVLFLGATGGCGLSALRRSLDAGFTCIALCRTPSKLTSVLPSENTGISKFGRDTPLLVAPLYKGLLHTPHEDKRAMEELLFASNEAWSVIRASFLTNGKEQPSGAVRVGIEDPVEGVEELAIGYSIAREDVGKWIFENILQKDGKDGFVRKVVTVTY
ncbi:fungal specific transcription factor domain-containing protein [Colletotrichum higginsianum]|nr:fungal specific transcription factor domain-containing protein [Colletotrichum higginsianum]